MDPQGRNLSTNMTGPDVALLHSELGQLGYTVPPPETRRQFFDPITLQSVQDFQRKRGLPVTGVVDPPTASVINAAVDALVAIELTAARLRLGSR
jgi:peptidoglycan hydrolase-like protein with peptidoglycan-binding domain